MPELDIYPFPGYGRSRNRPLLILALACFAFATAAQAAQDPAVTDTGDPEAIAGVVLRDNLGRDTPYGSFTGFLAAAEKFDYQAAVQFIDLRNLPVEVRQYSDEELARQLDFVIKRGMHIDLESLSRKVSGQIVDGLPDYRDELGRVVAEDGEEILYMQRVPGTDDNLIWKVSNATMAVVPELYDYLSYPQWVENIRNRVPADAGFLGIELFKWVIVLGVALASAPVFWLIGLLLSWMISKPGSALHQPVRSLLTRPLPLFAVVLLTGKLLTELGLSATAQRIVEANTLMTIIATWIVFSLIDLARARRRERFQALGRTDSHVLGRPMANALKLFTLLTAALFWLHNTGLDISTLLAGLGIGGVALALALQKPIEDLLGAVSIYSQQPIQTGDVCKYGTVFGQVEEIGLRTTRIRTLDNTLVSVPNCIIAHSAIENFSARKKLLYHPELPLRYDTTSEQLQQIIGGIDAMARAHDKVITDEVRIRFTDFSDNAIIIKARIYVDETDFDGYLAVVQDLNLAIMKIVQDAGAHFAQGAQTLMLENAALPGQNQAGQIVT
jgi:MscS family membrane protein